MLPALVACLAAATAPFQAEKTTPGPRPGVVVLAATSPRESAWALPRVTGRHVLLSLGGSGIVTDAPPQSNAASTLCSVRAGLPAAEDRAVAHELSRASQVELSGGTWIDWYLAAHDGRHEREWTRALREAHERGARVVAAGGAATWIAQHTVVPRDVVQKPSQDPHDTSLEVPVEGLGLFDAALVGVIADGAPTADRLIERATAYGFRDVLLLEGDVALAWDASARRATVYGPGTAAWIGLGVGTRSRGSVRAARAAILSDGDAFETRRGAIVDGRAVERRPSFDVLPFGALALHRTLAGEPSETPSRAASWIASAQAALDERSLRRPGGGWSGVLLDIEVRAP